MIFLNIILHPIAQLFFIVGALLIIIGIILFVEKGLDKDAKVKFFAIEFSIGSTSLVIAVMGFCIFLSPALFEKIPIKFNDTTNNKLPIIFFYIFGALIGASLALVVKRFIIRPKKMGISDFTNTETFSRVDIDNVEIWDGFIGDFKSYNDPWNIEYIDPRKYLKTHIKRYDDPECKIFKFLFFKKNGIQAFERFVKFQSLVHLNLKISDIHSIDFVNILEKRLAEPIKNSVDKIAAYINQENEPIITFFRGSKKDQDGEPIKVSLLYFTTQKSGRPKEILITHNKSVWEELETTWNNSADANGCHIYEGKKIFEEFIGMKRNEKY